MPPSARAVRFDRYGGPEVLHVEQVPMPVPARGEVLVEIRAAGINTGESRIRSGALHSLFPATFPSGQGSDLAGVVQQVGPGVVGLRVGDEVLGYSWTRSSHATHATIPEEQLVLKPATLDWATAGGLYVVACTAYAAVRAIGCRAGETVAVSAAAGGVGSLVVQLLALRGVRVLAIASAANHPWLERHGALPLAYGDGLRERLAAAAPHGIDAFIDLFGPDYVRLALDLGVQPDRIETIISFELAARVGARSEGSEDASSRSVLAEMAALVADGTVELPVAAAYPLDDVREAFRRLDLRHTHGKVVLVP
jgi:NADPH:quinone reductase-like Zn-dependent oxidoreductase